MPWGPLLRLPGAVMAELAAKGKGIGNGLSPTSNEWHTHRLAAWAGGCWPAQAGRLWACEQAAPPGATPSPGGQWRRSCRSPGHLSAVPLDVAAHEAATDGPEITPDGPMRFKTAMKLWITFGTGPGAPENAPFLPFGKAKSALALAPEGVTPQNVKMGMTKCARF